MKTSRSPRRGSPAAATATAKPRPGKQPGTNGDRAPFLERRRRAERALASVVAACCLLGVSTRRVEKLAASLGVTGRRDGGRVPVPAAGPRALHLRPGRALTQKVREDVRTVNVHCLMATGVNAGGTGRSCAASSPAACPGWPW